MTKKKSGWYREVGYEYMTDNKEEFIEMMDTFMLVDALEAGYEKHIIPLVTMIELLAEAIDTQDMNPIRNVIRKKGIVDTGEDFYTSKEAYPWEHGDQEED